MNAINKTLEKAWKLFDDGKYLEAESLYLECFEHLKASVGGKRNTVLMGLIYAECFLEKYEEARKYGKILLENAKNEEERHIALHQNGMIERMAENYTAALELFAEEEKIIHRSFSNEFMLIAVNLYEQGYVNLKMKHLGKAENIMRMSLDYAIKSKDDMCIGCSFRGMGEIMKEAQKTEEAMECFKKAILAFKNAGDLTAVEEVENHMQL